MKIGCAVWAGLYKIELVQQNNKFLENKIVDKGYNMNVYTGHELVTLANYVQIAEDDLWLYLNRAIENGQVDQIYMSEEAATNGDDYNSEYEFKKFSAIEFLAIIPVTV